MFSCITLACFVLFASTVNAAGASASALGVDYTEWFSAATQMATDRSGALYVFGYYSLPSGMAASSVTKLSPDGTTILWQDMLGFRASTMAVSPSGDVFVVPVPQAPDMSVSVAKLGASGAGVAWTAAAGFSFIGETAPALAADSQGRAYVAAPSGTNGTQLVTTVVRINAGGSAIDYTANVNGQAASIAADGSGAVVVAGSSNNGGFVARVAADGSAGYYTALPQDGAPATLALDSSGNAVVFGGGLLQRLNQAGAVTVSTHVVGAGSAGPLGVDAAGNAYVLGLIGQLYPVRNNIGSCRPLPLPGLLPTPTTVGTVPILTVVAPDGSVPQITYLPGAAFAFNGNNALLLAAGPDSTVFVATSPGSGFVPTRPGPFPEVLYPQSNILLHLSAQAFSPQTASLACLGNAATYFIYPVAPGEIVTLIGSGLGPMQGTLTQATAQSPYPGQASGVQVTFDGTPAPLLWVQDSQINAIAPWSLTPGTNTEICVSSGGTKTNCLTWPVAQTAPGVFTADGVHAAALNQDGSLNTAANPAAVGSIVSVFAAGLGQINPAQADGALVGVPLPLNVVQAGVEAEFYVLSPPFGVRVESAPVPVTYAGPAPYLVAGTSQVNFQIAPSDTSLAPLPASPIGYYLAPGGLNSLNLPSSTTSQVFQVFVAGQ